MKPITGFQRAISNFCLFYPVIGLWHATLWFVTLLLSKAGLRGHGLIEVEMSWLLYPVKARIWGASDMDALKMVLIDQEHSSLKSLQNVTSILDLGANVGYSSLYFLNSFPNARILAIEPDPANFELCRQNLLPYRDRARVIQGAVWSECTDLSFGSDVFCDGKEWSVHVVRPPEGENGSVKAWDVRTLIQMANFSEIHILKIDIEGAEVELFNETAQQWLQCVRNLCIELHNDECRQRFFEAMRAFDYDHETSGELTICKNIRAKAS